MKAILPYIVLFVGSLVTAGAVLGGVYAFRPDLLGLAPPPAVETPANTPRADSTTTAPRTAPLPVYGPTVAELRGKDPLTVARDSVALLIDSLRSVGRLLADARTRMDSLSHRVEPERGAVDTATVARSRDDRDRKAMTKMLESMAADNVVRLLQGMSDEEVKELLLSLKTKQAAKILAALDPDRAAKLIRGTP